MPDTKPGRQGLQTLAILFVLGAVVLLGGPGAAALMLLCSWPIAAWMAADDFSHGAAALLVIAGCSLSRLPTALILVCAGLGFIGLAADRLIGKPAFRAGAWGLLSLTMLCICAVAFHAAYPGELSESLARGLTDVLAARPDADSLLIQLAQAGSFNLGSLLPESGQMTAALREEMFRTVNSYAQTALSLLIPQMTGVLPVICAWLCLMPASLRRRRRGITTHVLPKAETWRLPRDYLGTTVGLWVTSLVLMCLEGRWEALGLAVTAFLEAVLAVQGCCGLIARWKHKGVRAFARNLRSTLLVLIVPIVPVVVGIFDLITNYRGLRGPKEREGTL